MKLTTNTDLWEYLRTASKPILLYGMGNGADKILAVCQAYGIEVTDFFASDGFVRGHSFHGKIVLSYSEAKQKYGSFIVLLSFASSLPHVLDLIHKVAEENELYAPDVPVFGNQLFNMRFFREHERELDEVYSLLADQTSKDTFRSVIEYKLSGDIRFLDACESDEEMTTRRLIRPETVRTYVDLGAYNGDTVKRLIPQAPELRNVLALEPDRRNFRKLSEYADSLSGKIRILPKQLAAWHTPQTLLMDASGNRNANLSAGGKKTVEIRADALDNVIGDLSPDYIKYDVEGSELKALEGSLATVRTHRPRLLVSLYHRSEDLFVLPLMLKKELPQYKFYLRKLRYIPAWDLNLYAIPDGSEGEI